MRSKDLGTAAALLLGVGLLQKQASAGPTAALYSKCSRACAACMKACQACNKHCIGMAAAGMKGHEKSIALSADCRDICDVAAKLTARRGPMSVAIVEACLKACEACGAECGKSPEMAPMAACAKSCAECAATCRELIKA